MRTACYNEIQQMISLSGNTKHGTCIYCNVLNELNWPSSQCYCNLTNIIHSRLLVVLQRTIFDKVLAMLAIEMDN